MKYFEYFLDGKEYCRLSTTSEEIIQNVNNNESYKMFNRIGSISISVSVFFSYLSEIAIAVL